MKNTPKLLVLLSALALSGVLSAQSPAPAPTAAAPAPAAAPAKIVANPEAAKNKVAMCLGCHNIIGWRASFPETHRVPMLAGQTATYIANSLNAYKKGDRKHPTMRAIAETLTEQDIADISTWYEAQGKTAAR